MLSTLVPDVVPAQIDCSLVIITIERCSSEIAILPCLRFHSAQSKNFSNCIRHRHKFGLNRRLGGDALLLVSLADCSPCCLERKSTCRLPCVTITSEISIGVAFNMKNCTALEYTMPVFFAPLRYLNLCLAVFQCSSVGFAMNLPSRPTAKSISGRVVFVYEEGRQRVEDIGTHATRPVLVITPGAFTRRRFR